MSLPTLQRLIDRTLHLVRDAKYGSIGIAAQGKFTFTDQPSPTEYVTIGTQAFTFQVAARTAAGQVQIAGSLSATLDNLVTAIGLDIPTVATAAKSGTTMVIVTSIVKGKTWTTIRIPFSENCTNCTADGSGYLGGTTEGYYGDRARDALNETLRDIASRVKLPRLKVIAEFEAGTAYTANLPATLDRGVFWAWNQTQDAEVTIWPTLVDLRKEYGSDFGNAGNVFDIAIEGGSVYYPYIPAVTETIELHGYGPITEMDDFNDTPSCLPANYNAERLLCNGAAARIWGEIEQDLSGEKPNTAYHTALYEKYVAELTSYIISLFRPNTRPKPPGHWI